MFFRDCTLLSENERSSMEELFDIQISKELTPIGFEDGEHRVPALRIHFFYDSGRAVMLLDRDWLTKDLYAMRPNEVKLVWRDAREGQSQWHVKYFPHICKTSIESDKLRNDEVVAMTTVPAKHTYLFFKDTTLGQISVVHPFAQFTVSKALFTEEELASLGINSATSLDESDYDRFKKLFDSVGQTYTTATLREGDAEQKGYRNDVVYGIALVPPTVDPPRLWRAHWPAPDAYTMAFYFDRAGKYVGTCTIPT